jgi:hypothetical protein
MTSNVTDLRKALRKGVQDFNTNNYRIAVDNKDFEKPADGSPWFRLLIEEGTPRARSFGHDEYSGYLQLDVNTKLQQGEAQSDEIAQVAATFFRAGRVLKYGDTEAVVRSCARSRGREVDGWWRVSLTVYWDARIDRPGLA